MYMHAILLHLHILLQLQNRLRMFKWQNNKVILSSVNGLIKYSVSVSIGMLLLYLLCKKWYRCIPTYCMTILCIWMSVFERNNHFICLVSLCDEHACVQQAFR